MCTEEDITLLSFVSGLAGMTELEKNYLANMDPHNLRITVDSIDEASGGKRTDTML